MCIWIFPKWSCCFLELNRNCKSLTGFWHFFFLHHFGHFASSHICIHNPKTILTSLPQGELPAAPTGPGRDDRVQAGEAWRREQGLQKDPVHQGGRQQPAGRRPARLARVLPPGCNRPPQHLPVITQELSVQSAKQRVIACTCPTAVFTHSGGRSGSAAAVGTSRHV